MPNKNRILIVPDVHGRSFWHACQEKIHQVSQIIFLGDYTDPYGYEGLNEEDALSELRQIIAFKKQNPEKVILLIGNHDLPYIFPNAEKNNRYSEEYAPKFHELFTQNRNLFQLFHEVKGEEQTYLFSHAGITHGWLLNNLTRFPQSVVDALFSDKSELAPPSFLPLNALLTEEDSAPLSDISYYRGGLEDYGSPLWADLTEWETEESFPGFYQIFGHTQLETPLITDSFACIDCRQIYELN